MVFECQQCGWCCKNTVINVSKSDIDRWKLEQRDDILSEVSFIANYPRDGVGGFYIRKSALNPKQPCPFYNGSCMIYATRPVACRDYPLAVSKPEGCPAYVQQPKHIIHRIKQRQTVDFKQANECLHELLQVLTRARVKVHGK